MKKNKIKIIKNNHIDKCDICKTWQKINRVKLNNNEYRMNICQRCKVFVNNPNTKRRVI